MRVPVDFMVASGSFGPGGGAKKVPTMPKSSPKEIGGRYLRRDKIGGGTYGTVYWGEDRLSGHFVALKRVSLDVDQEGGPEAALREVGCLMKLRHPHIVSLYDMVEEECPPTRMYLVFELLEKDLKHFLDSYPPNQDLSAFTVKRITQEITEGVSYCHMNGIIHRDLKPHNILIGHHGIVKIADFGLARPYDMTPRNLSPDVVTLWYRAPELILGSRCYGCAIDIWSIGCILAELLEKAPMFRGDSEIDQLFRIFRVLGTPDEGTWKGVSGFPNYQVIFPKWCRVPLSSVVRNLTWNGLDLLEKMLTYDPRRRITALEILSHNYFQEPSPTVAPVVIEINS